MFTEALFTVTKLWKQHRCPSTDEWIKKMWHVHNGVLFSHNKNKIMWLSEKWIDLESIVFSEISQIMTTCHVFSHVNLEGKKNNMEVEEELLGKKERRGTMKCKWWRI
jgi:hypothetical protein